MRKRPVKIGGREITVRLDEIDAKIRMNRNVIILHTIIIVCAVCAGIAFL